MYENLKITAWLQCGVVADAYLPIDAILYYQVYRDAYGPEIITLPGANQSGVGHVPMPLRRLNLPYEGFRFADGGPLWRGQADNWIITMRETPWYYAASFAQWNDAVAEGQDYWNKRFDQSLADLVDFQGRRGKVIVEQGTYKAYHMPVWYRHALSVSWYVVGDGAAIERLLCCATHIGKKHAQGWGAVLRWRVEPWHADWSVYGEDGRLMRAIPAERGIRTGIRPSYWMAKNHTVCQVPPYQPPVRSDRVTQVFEHEDYGDPNFERWRKQKHAEEQDTRRMLRREGGR